MAGDEVRGTARASSVPRALTWPWRPGLGRGAVTRNDSCLLVICQTRPSTYDHRTATTQAALGRTLLDLHRAAPDVAAA